MNILVVGGTRFFGRKTVELLLAQGHEITLLSRGETPLPWDDGVLEHLGVDRGDPQAVSAALSGRVFDVIYDNIAMNDEHVRTVLDCVAEVGHYLLTSSGSVYHHDRHVPAAAYIHSDGPGRDDWTEMMKPLSEDAIPLDGEQLDVEIAHEEPGYRKGKLQAERELVRARDERGIPCTIFRPPQVEGPWDPTRRTEFFARRVKDGGGFLVPCEGLGRVFQKVYRDDVATAIVAAVGNQRSHNRAYNVAQDEVLSMERYLYVMADCLHVPPPRIVALPAARIAAELGDDYRIPLPTAKTVRTDGARRDLDFSPTPYLSWMKKTLEWIFAGEPPQGYGEVRARELKMLSEMGRC